MAGQVIWTDELGKALEERQRLFNIMCEGNFENTPWGRRVSGCTGPKGCEAGVHGVICRTARFRSEYTMALFSSWSNRATAARYRL
jgi:hypothetical protein